MAGDAEVTERERKNRDAIGGSRKVQKSNAVGIANTFLPSGVLTTMYKGREHDLQGAQGREEKCRRTV